jgi:hypothetical protein
VVGSVPANIYDRGGGPPTSAGWKATALYPRASLFSSSHSLFFFFFGFLLFVLFAYLRVGRGGGGERRVLILFLFDSFVFTLRLEVNTPSTNTAHTLHKHVTHPPQTTELRQQYVAAFSSRRFSCTNAALRRLQPNMAVPSTPDQTCRPYLEKSQQTAWEGWGYTNPCASVIVVTSQALSLP